MSDQPVSAKKANIMKVAVVIAIAVIYLGFTAWTRDNNDLANDNNTAPQNDKNQEQTPVNDAVMTAYADGVYTATGTYVSPGGPEEIEVTLTLENGIVIESNVVPQAELPISVKLQNDFAANYKEQVVGKSIDDIQLTKIATSSLTPIGFNDAVDKIKQQAQDAQDA